MYVELPLIETSTPAERLQALKDAKALLAGTPKTTTGFFAGSVEPTDAVAPDNMIRVAEYITTGHDYKDTHPEGKRRPIIHNHHQTINIAPVAVDSEDVPEELHDFIMHLLHHNREDGCEPETADDEKSAKQDPSPEADPDRDSDTPPPAFP